MKIISGLMDRNTLDALLKAKNSVIWDVRDEIFNERKGEAMDDKDLAQLDNSYRFKLIENISQDPNWNYFLLLCY